VAPGAGDVAGVAFAAGSALMVAPSAGAVLDPASTGVSVEASATTDGASARGCFIPESREAK
jgi:hypothetical protein